MAERKSGFLHKQYGPLTGGAWVGVTGGVVFAWIIIRRYASARAAAAQQAATTPTAGSSIPAGQSAAGSSTTTTGAAGTPAAPTDLESWTTAALHYAYRGETVPTLNAIQNWLSGNCVDHLGYVSISEAIRHIGLPPYMQSFPVLTVCPGSVSPPPGTPSTTPPPTTTTPPPPTTTPTGPVPNGATVAGVLRDLTLVNQAKAAGTTDPTSFWANFGALAQDFQTNPALAPEVVALANGQTPPVPVAQLPAGTTPPHGTAVVGGVPVQYPPLLV